MKYVLLVISSLLLSACGTFDRDVARITGGASEVCIDGVTYLQFTSGATVKVDRAGVPVPC